MSKSTWRPESPFKKARLLKDYSWYRNMAGGWTHPHCMDFLTA